MKELMVLALIGVVVVVCVKAVLSAKLLEKDPKNWEKFQAVEEERRRRRQELLGKAALQGIRLVSSLMKKKE